MDPNVTPLEDDDQVSSRAPGVRPLIIARTVGGWLVKDGWAALRSFDDLGQAQRYADLAVIEAKKRGETVELVDLSVADPSVRDDAQTLAPELLDAGQEEVFSETEVEMGRIEHQSSAGTHE